MPCMTDLVNIFSWILFLQNFVSCFNYSTILIKIKHVYYQNVYNTNSQNQLMISALDWLTSLLQTLSPTRNSLTVSKKMTYYPCLVM